MVGGGGGGGRVIILKYSYQKLFGIRTQSFEDCNAFHENDTFLRMEGLRHQNNDGMTTENDSRLIFYSNKLKNVGSTWVVDWL